MVYFIFLDDCSDSLKDSHEFTFDCHLPFSIFFLYFHPLIKSFTANDLHPLHGNSEQATPPLLGIICTHFPFHFWNIENEKRISVFNFRFSIFSFQILIFNFLWSWIMEISSEKQFLFSQYVWKLNGGMVHPLQSTKSADRHAKCIPNLFCSFTNTARRVTSLDSLIFPTVKHTFVWTWGCVGSDEN